MSFLTGKIKLIFPAASRGESNARNFLHHIRSLDPVAIFAHGQYARYPFKKSRKTTCLIFFALLSLCLLTAAGADASPLPAGGASSGAGGATARFAPAKSENPNPLGLLKDAVVTFFNPMEGDVLAVKDGLLTVAISNSASVKAGMRMKVLKKGAEFFHPVTGEPLGRIEQPVGDAQVVNGTSAGGRAQLKLLDGQAGPGNIVRISGARVRLLFYQLRDVSWGLSEEYYELLKKTGRFDLLASPLDNEKDALAEGRRLKADAVLIISQETLPPEKTSGGGGSTVLSQKLIWTSDSVQALESGSVIKSGQLKQLTLGDKLFAPKNNSLIMFRVPFGAHLVSIANVLPDRQLLLLATRNDISFYSISSSLLSPALDGSEIKGRSWEDFLRVQPADIGGGGRDEIIIGAKGHGEIFSYIYAFENGKFTKLWEAKGLFLRWIDGRLYAQRVSVASGFEGQIHPAKWDGTEKRVVLDNAKPAFPKGINIFDFALMDYDGKTLIIAYDDRGFINVYDDGTGALLWRSAGSFGGFPIGFKKEGYNPTQETGQSYEREGYEPAQGSRWYIKDKIVVTGHDALLIERQPLLKMARGLGYKSSRIGVLRWDGASMKQLVLGDKLPGTISDFAASKDRLVILESPVFGVQLGRILQGDSPFTTRLYMYPLGDK